MMLIEIALILVYTCVLIIKSCSFSPTICETFGLGDTSKGKPQLVSGVNRWAWCRLPFEHRAPKQLVSAGVYLFFIFFGLSMMLLQLVIGAVNLYLTGRVPKILLVAKAHGLSPWHIIKKVASRRYR